MLIFRGQDVTMSDIRLEPGVVERGLQRVRRGHWPYPVVAFAVLLSISTESVCGQPTPPEREPASFINQQRSIEERLRRQYDAEVGDAQRALFDWGGWYNSYVFLFDDGVESSRTFRRHDLRLWGRVVVEDGAHEFYARTLLSFLDFNSGDSYDGNDDDVWGPNLERGYYRFDLAKAMRAYQGRSPGYDLVVTAGRDLVEFGTGLALAAPLDHVSLRGTYRAFELTALAGKSIGSTEDFDLSRSATRNHRDFYGTQLKYVGFERHEPFIFAFWQRDRNWEAFWRPFQRFDYDSFYLGIGSSGELASRLRYATEWVYETGNSYGHRQFIHDNDIDAWAVLAELEYLFPGKHNARASVEYLFGSGDADRFASPTNSIAGNTGDFDDTSFIGFGYRDTGLSFAPRYSNLHMWRAGASCYPWPEHRRLRRFELGTDWYLYYKHHRAGAVSDPTAAVQSGYLGCEMDYFANWRVTADLAWTARMGMFFPGKAFPDRSVRPFFLVGMTWSF